MIGTRNIAHNYKFMCASLASTVFCVSGVQAAPDYLAYKPFAATPVLTVLITQDAYSSIGSFASLKDTEALQQTSVDLSQDVRPQKDDSVELSPDLTPEEVDAFDPYKYNKEISLQQDVDQPSTTEIQTSSTRGSIRISLVPQVAKVESLNLESEKLETSPPDTSTQIADAESVNSEPHSFDPYQESARLSGVNMPVKKQPASDLVIERPTPDMGTTTQQNALIEEKTVSGQTPVTWLETFSRIPLMDHRNSSHKAAQMGPEFTLKRINLHDGEKGQYAKALENDTQQPTIKNDDINRYLINPPDADGTAVHLRDVLIYTLLNNPTIAAAEWRTVDARFAKRVSQADLLPQMEVGGSTGAESTLLEGEPRVAILQRTEAYIRLRQRIFDFGRSRNNIRRAEALRQARELEHEDVVNEILYSAIIAYLGLLGAEELYQSGVLDMQAHEDIVALVQKNYDAGNFSEAELKRSQSRLDRSRTNLIEFENGRERAMGEFRKVTGLDPRKLLPPSLQLEEAYALSAANLDDYLQYNPAMQALLREIHALKHQALVAKGQNRPEVNFEVSSAYKQNVLGAETWAADSRAMLTASWGVYDGGAAKARRMQVLARENETRQLLLQLRNELRQDAYNIINVLQTSRNKRDILSEQVVASQRVVELYAKQFEAGRRSLLELLDAQADLAAANQDGIKVKYENISAAVASLRIQNKLIPFLKDEYGLPSKI